MKKLSILLLISLISSSSSLTILSCSSKIYGTDMSKINDYDWSKEEPYFKGFKNVGVIDKPNDENKVQKLNIIGNKNVETYFNLKKNPTSFKTSNEIKKQSATSSPLNSKFLPNGNLKSDMSIVERKDFYSRTNQLKDWKYLLDVDAKYNSSKIPLQKTLKTMDKWVESQDERTKEMNMSTIIENTSMANTIVGNKRTYERSFNNYQYNDILVSWAGATDEGIIVPPGKNQTEKAHLNGTKILGNIFLDGYHGLTSEILKGFLVKNNSGEYLAVDVLIEMAVELGFDGWFWNNEPNGSQPNGFIVDNQIMYEIMAQLQQKINKSKNEEIKNLIIIGYKNQGVLKTDKNGYTNNIDSEKIFQNTNEFLNDFYVFPNEVETYINYNNLENRRFNIYNMYNTGAWVGGKIWLDKDKIGKKDLRDLNYTPFDMDGKSFVDAQGNIDRKAMIAAYQLINEQHFTYKTKSSDEKLGGARNSIALFASHVPYDLASQQMDKISNGAKKTMETDTFGLVAANDYDDRMYTGSNKKLSNKDEGVTLYPGSEPVQENIFKDKSYGVGNLVQEKTVLIDDNPYFKTNFSTGQGNQFITIDENNERKVIENYPWSNTNVGDVQPTYKWDVQKVDNSTRLETNTNSITGFYDYYNPYLKGNSITLGGGYDNTGKILNAEWDPNSTYVWNIMGSNYNSSNKKEISMKVRVPQEVEINDIKIIVNDISNNYKYINNINVKEINSSADGYKWVEINGDFKDKIGKIGLLFKTPEKSENKFTISCGEIKVVVDSQQNDQNLVGVSNREILLESIIRRDYNNFIRFSLSESEDDSSDIYNHYEVYYENDDQKLVRITENNTPNFYIKDVDKKYNNFYIKQIDKNNKVSWFSFDIS